MILLIGACKKKKKKKKIMIIIKEIVSRTKFHELLRKKMTEYIMALQKLL